MTTGATAYYYVRPTDSLFVRGNLVFGDSGEHGTAMIPPPPSLFAGAFRSALLSRGAEQLSAFLNNGRCSHPALAQCLGTPAVPGDFRLTWLSMAGDPGPGAVPEAISLLPADLLFMNNNFASLEPKSPATGVLSAGDLPLRATLVSTRQEKPLGDVLLRVNGFARYLQGDCPRKDDGLETKHIYLRDARLGIGLNADARTAEEGQIYTTEGFAFSPRQEAGPSVFASTGFMVGIQGMSDLLPDQGLLRLGGDGRSAHYRKVNFSAPVIKGPIGESRRFRVVLQTPALFTQGWLPNGVTGQDGRYRLLRDGFSARLACAALGRRDIVSGWDLYNWLPKPAQAAAPAGSVYWFDEFTGDAGKLATWVENGLWPDDLDMLQQNRRAEGYNRALLGAWN